MLKVLFSSQARIELLKLFLLNSSGRYYLRQIQHLTGQPLQAIQRETEKLAHIGLLEAERDGNRLYYSVNRSFLCNPSSKVLRCSLKARKMSLDDLQKQGRLRSDLLPDADSV